MDMPATFWPWAWWTAPAVAFAVAIGIAGSAYAVVAVENLRLRWLARRLQEELPITESAFGVGAAKNHILVAGTTVSVIDAEAGRVVQRLRLAQIATLKIYEDATDHIGLRLISMSGARSRKVVTTSIIEVARLCNSMAAAGKELEYLEE